MKQSRDKPVLLGGFGEINFGKQYRQGNRVYSSNALAMCLGAGQIGNLGGNSYLYVVKKNKIIKNSLKKGSETMAKVGDMIEIIDMVGEPQYTGKQGTIKSIDSIGQLHGTWGGLAVVPGEDSFRIIAHAED